MRYMERIAKNKGGRRRRRARLLALSLPLCSALVLAALLFPFELDGPSARPAVFDGPDFPFGRAYRGPGWQLYFNAPDARVASGEYKGGLEAVLAAALREARETVDIAVYELNSLAIYQEILHAEARGLRVRIVADDEHGLDDDAAYLRDLRAAGIALVTDERSALMHNKFVILDGRSVWTGSWNYTVNGSYRNNNNVFVMESALAAAAYQAEFEEMFLRGEFGFSFSYRKDVGELIAQRLPRTIGIALAAHAISSLVGIALGIYVANRQYSLSDNAAATFAFIATSVPRFSLALIFLYLLVFALGQEHVSSMFSPQYRQAPWSIEKALDLVKHIWPVVFIAGFGGVARNLRVMRGNLLDVLNQQYVTTARSKGLHERRVMNRHAVPNALHPIIAYQGTAVPYMLQGELEAAIVFGLPTIAPMFAEALLKQDIYISGSVMLLYGILLILGNFIADMALGILDPRISYS